MMRTRTDHVMDHANDDEEENEEKAPENPNPQTIH